jgi:hypothetical protein
MFRFRSYRKSIIAALPVVFALGGCSDSSDNTGPTANCGTVAARALQVCLGDMNRAQRACYVNSDSACEQSAPDFLAARDTLEDELQSSCADGEFLGLSQDALVGRLQSACQSQSDSLAWRTFGGPLGVVWPEASEEQQSCLQSAHDTASQFMDEALAAINQCLNGDTCDVTILVAEQEASANTAAASITAACPALEPLISLTPEIYVERAEDQLDCIISTAHEDASSLSPQCGPSNVDVMPARGEWTQLILDREKWGTMCGDGSDYAIQLRLAPEGYPVDRIVMALAGGGVCLFEDDCKSSFESSPELFSALDDPAPVDAGGLVGDTPDNPFANWTRAYFPYCNRDVFIGGGAIESFDGFDLPRFGAINLRSGIRVVRDILWKHMDESSDTGFRPDELIALFGGFSAGAYGTLYNYHWVLDDLQWPRTAAFPDAGGALDNGSPVGISSLAPIKIPAWSIQPYIPPYCITGECIIGPINYQIMSPRLKRVPEQQYLILSNQKDNTQQGDAFFTDEAQWIDAMRSAYCETKDLPGIQWYLTSDSVNSVHVVSLRDEFYYGEVAGERMVDWLWRAVTSPDSISDWAEEGDFTTDIPGSSPFPCELP